MKRQIVASLFLLSLGYIDFANADQVPPCCEIMIQNRTADVYLTPSYGNASGSNACYCTGIPGSNCFSLTGRIGSGHTGYEMVPSRVGQLNLQEFAGNSVNVPLTNQCQSTLICKGPIDNVSCTLSP